MFINACRGCRFVAVACLLVAVMSGCELLEPQPRVTTGPMIQRDPWMSLGEGGLIVRVGESRGLPHPTVSSFPPVIWQLPSESAAKATLLDAELLAKAPGAFGLEANSGDRRARFWVAAIDQSLETPYFEPNTPMGSGSGQGPAIINTQADWTARYESFFGRATTARGVSQVPAPNKTTAPSPPPVPPVDFSRHSVFVMQLDLGKFENNIVITQVSSGAVELVVTASRLDGVEPRPHNGSHRVIRMIPKVPDDTLVRVVRMPDPPVIGWDHPSESP